MRTRIFEAVYYTLKASDLISKFDVKMSRKLRSIAEEILKLENVQEYKTDKKIVTNFSNLSETPVNKNENTKCVDIDSKVNEYLEMIRTRILQGETKRSIFSKEES